MKRKTFQLMNAICVSSDFILLNPVRIPIFLFPSVLLRCLQEINASRTFGDTWGPHPALPLPLPLRRRGLGRAPTGECRASRTAEGSHDEASDSPPSRSGLQGSSYIRRDGSESCFLREKNQRRAPAVPPRARSRGDGRTPYLFSRRPLPVSRKPLAKGLLSIFSCVICPGGRRREGAM